VVVMVIDFSFFIKTLLIFVLLAFGSATNPIYDGKDVDFHMDKLLTATKVFIQERILLEIKMLLL
jgi:hypothetical protein